MNKSEEFVYNLCQRSFFRLWSYPNPRKKDSHKELCDIIVVCGNNVLLISVKEILIKESGDYSVDLNRWIRKAVDASVSQLYGADRILKTMTDVIASGGEKAIELPDITVRNIYRIAIALGDREKYPLKSGDFGSGLVHVFDEIAWFIIINELDTIKDFTDYLHAKEALLENMKILFSGEEDLLAYYLSHDCKFDLPIKDGLKGNLFIEEGIWKEFSDSDEYKEYRKELEPSYAWDRIINILLSDYFSGRFIEPIGLKELDIVLRLMALEGRGNRLYLSEGLLDYFKKTDRIRSRVLNSPSGIIYVVLATERWLDRELRRAELLLRCMVIRTKVDSPEIIGLATEKIDRKKSYSIDIAYLNLPVITDELLAKIQKGQKELNLFDRNIDKTRKDNKL
ncbi:MAG TPA: hypothetical protein VMW91_01415 [Desulfosporosinus sp.]|nr:hypothetical protein [Desulfosporosinus sp.]